MIWIDSISKLQYYNNKPGWNCYCDHLYYAADLMLQAILNDGDTSYTTAIYVYSVDGLTNLETATSYFDVYAASIPNSTTHYVNMRLKSFSPQMCLQKCFILRVVITNNSSQIVWDKFTERYCQTICCDTARNITILQDGLEISGDDSGVLVNPDAPLFPSIPTAECGYPLIRIASTFTCRDLFNGEYYGNPGTVYNGQATFNFTKISNIQGRIVQRPREITRETSFNCRLQRSESFIPYLVEGYEMFPTWKMAELEGQFHANFIQVYDYVQTYDLQYAGGQVFPRKITGARECDEYFKLFVTLQACTIRQTFGCDECVANDAYFLIPEGYDSGWFYDENGQAIASTYDGENSSPFVMGLLQWLRAQDNVYSVEDIDVSGFDCEMFALVKIQATGAIPTSIYFDYPTARNRIYLLTLEDVTDICGYTGNNPCAMPVNGTVVISDFTCATPVNDTVIITEVTPTTLTISDFGTWVIDGTTDASVYAGQVSMNLKSVGVITGLTGEDVALANEVIGVMSADGRPQEAVLLNEANGMPADTNLVIYPNGLILFSGVTTLTADNEATIDLSGLIYNTQ